MTTKATILHDVFELSVFRPGQEAVIDRLLAGRSVLSVFPTGAGKSLCYQLPALLLDGVTVVVSPLIALMKDQVDALRRKGVLAARLDSTLTQKEVAEIHELLEKGQIRLLYVAPERLSSERFVNRLRGLKIPLLAVDEAHCISEWGHNFRPDYLKIARIARDLGVGRVLALTATATPSVAADVRRGFGIADEDHVQIGFHRPNLEMRVTPVRASERTSRLTQQVSAHPGPTIVYVTLQKTSEEVAGALGAAGVSARAYHAGLETDERTAVQDSFMRGETRVVVATIAFGMGIDKADIRAV
ncbi:MAG: ATP-dependent DNA helicase RecQ, partial [Planctomycetota bacterium]